MTYWFTGDFHDFHSKICSYCNRPFKNSIDMHNELVKRFNEVVKYEDHCFLLGDICFGSRKKFERLISELNCKNLYFIKGNHKDYVEKEGIKEKFKFIKDYHDLWIQDVDAWGGKQLIVLCHYPIEQYRNKHLKSIHCHAHSHNKLPVTKNSIRRIDVGVDAWNYYPVSYEQIKEEVYKRELGINLTK